jgi:dolichyl-phosphate-mannose-protein mannosyltransferase
VSAVAIESRARKPRTARWSAAIYSVLKVGVAAGAVTYAAEYAYVLAHRIGYPFELEWIEGGSLNSVARVMHGHALYSRPTLTWAPNIYPPLYYWISSIAARVGGLNFTSLRAVSVCASVVVCGAVWGLVRRDTGGLIGPTAAVGLFLASYRIGGAWFDVARVDMVFMAFLFTGLYAARSTERPAHAVVAGSLLFLALLSKQCALVPALAVLPWMWTRGRRCLAAFASTFALETVAVVGALQVRSGGWFAYYTWTVPGRHEIERSAVLGFWTRDLVGHVWPALLLAIGALVWSFGPRRPQTAWFHGPVFAGLLFAAYSARLHTGGWDNVLLPAYAGVAVLAGVAVGRAGRSPAVASAALAVVALQMVLLQYDPARQVPDAGATTAGKEVVAELRALRRPVLLTGQPWLLRIAGHEADVSAHASALQDVFRAKAGAAAARLEAELEAALRSHRFCTVVLDTPAVYSAMPADFGRYYAPTAMLAAAARLRPVTGYPITPGTVWTPIGAPSCGKP